MTNTYPAKRPMFDIPIPGGQLVDVSTASISYVPIFAQGVVHGAYATISAAVTGSDTTVTVKVQKGGVSTTIGTITVAVSGSAPGSTFVATMTGKETDRSVNSGDTLIFDSDGVSSTASIANFLGVLREQ